MRARYMSNVIVYDIPLPSLQAMRMYYSIPASDILTAGYSDAETQIYWRWENAPVVWPQLYHQQANDIPVHVSSSNPAEGDLWVIIYDVPLPSLHAARLYNGQQAGDVPIVVPPQPETNPHWIATRLMTRMEIWR